MPFVRRNAENTIDAMFAAETADAKEWLPAGHPEVLSFMDGGKDGSDFASLDVTFIRVIEDVVDVLIHKGVMRLTDLPSQAQEKLMARKGFRDRRSDNSLDLLGDQELI